MSNLKIRSLQDLGLFGHLFGHLLHLRDQLTLLLSGLSQVLGVGSDLLVESLHISLRLGLSSLLLLGQFDDLCLSCF